MASEILSVPEERLAEVVEVIRVGLAFAATFPGGSKRRGIRISRVTRRHLKEWCDEQEAYLKRLAS